MGMSDRSAMLWLGVLFSIWITCTSRPQEVTVEQWMQYQLNLTGPSALSGNPFVDVDLSATFSLVLDTSRTNPVRVPHVAQTELPQPLVQLEVLASTEVRSDGGVKVYNTGSSGKVAPTGTAINVQLGSSVPAGDSVRAVHSINFGSDIINRHVVEIPGDNYAFSGGLAGLTNFTLTSWIRVDGGEMGSGGNRVVNFCKGGPGIDLVWDATAGYSALIE